MLTTTPKARHFMNPLLVTLYDLTEGEANTPVKMTDTYDNIMSILGIDSQDAYGQTNEGKDQVVQWIQWAFKNLKRTKLVENAGRGRWALTPKGVTKAKVVTPVVKDNAPMDTSKTPTTSTLGVALPITKGQDEGSGYHPDPYVRSLACSPEVTPCFGHYSTQSDLCQSCPVQGPCINYQAAFLSHLAAVLKSEDNVLTTDNKTTLTTEDGAQDTSEEDTINHGFFSSYAISKALYTVARIELICEACRLTIRKGDPTLWVRSSQDSEGHGMFHIACVPESLRPKSKEGL